MNADNTNTSDLSDLDVTLYMRKSNYEKFKTLVRMHLSFELDLNTDEFDLPCHEIVYEEKGKMKKWSRISKKQRHLSGSGCASSVKCSTSVDNSPMEAYSQIIDSGFLFHLAELKSFLLLKRNLTQEGIFRKTGSISRQNELRLHIHKEEPLNLDSGDYSAHDCATVFKAYLADMSEPLLTDAHYPAHLQIAPLCLSTPLNISSNSSLMRPERAKREQHLLNSVQLLMLLLPEENRQLFQHVIEILHSVMQYENVNKMSPDNLATLFAPHLICPRNLPPEALHYVSKKLSSIIAYMVAKGSIIFDVPAKLITDIRAYLLERKRKKTMSPEQTLDESISDMSTVNTVYTFVDREKTAAAHTANTTDTELAQLYAHIQSLPESSKKRRLIKQFNKQNGQGTPLQLVVMNRLKNSEAPRTSKSISDSIKKHIFHKSIMSRTPKRTNVPLGIDQTPNLSNAKNPKLRVLFRSPAAEVSRSGITEISSSTTSLMHASSNTFATIKSHPLQKSISSYVLNSPSLNCPIGEGNESSSSCSSDGYLQQNVPSKSNGYSISAPVSRQSSDDFNEQSTSNSDSNKYESRTNCMNSAKTELTIIKQKINNADNKKSVVWNESNLLNIEKKSNPCTPIHENTIDLKSRFKSEPNLNRIVKDKIECIATGQEVNSTSKCSKFLTRKLIKGVSMSNIKLPFNTPDTTRRLVRSVSSTLKRCPSDEQQCETRFNIPLNTGVTLLEDVDDEDLDDETFEESPDDQLDSYSSTESHNIDDDIESSDMCGMELQRYSGSVHHRHVLLQHSNVYRNMDLLTSTPSLLIGKRRSMSPITKSTQRMPKSMQESIMTPRSRKPVMVITNNANGSDQNQTICQADLSSFREQDEDDSYVSHTELKKIPILNSESNDSLKNESIICTSKDSSKFPTNGDEIIDGKDTFDTIDTENALTTDFKEYLRRRSVLTASPTDLSFSSQPDDFDSSDEIEDINRSKLSKSLLFCLDGNEPDDEDKQYSMEPSTSSSVNRNEPKIIQSGKLLGNSRKRELSVDLNETTATNFNEGATANKENYENIDKYLLTKKLLITEHPGETSF